MPSGSGHSNSALCDRAWAISHALFQKLQWSFSPALERKFAWHWLDFRVQMLLLTSVGGFLYWGILFAWWFYSPKGGIEVPISHGLTAVCALPGCGLLPLPMLQRLRKALYRPRFVEAATFLHAACGFVVLIITAVRQKDPSFVMVAMVIIHTIRVIGFWPALVLNGCSFASLLVWIPNINWFNAMFVACGSAVCGWLTESGMRREFLLHEEVLMQKGAETEFVARISHEIRTPLSGMVGFLELLQNTELSATQRQYVTEMGSVAQLLSNVINDTLDFVKMDAGRMLLCLKPASVEETVQACVSLFQPHATKRGNSLSWHVDPKVPSIIRMDKLRVQQMLNNYLNNAIKFTELGAIRVEVTPHTEQGKPGIRVEVADTGSGFPPEDSRRVFEPFQQSDANVARTHGGTGLGLPIVKEFAQLMGGSVGCSSVPGKGSTFFFVIAAEAAETVAEEQRPVEQQVMREAYHVMVVDDTPVNLRLAAAMVDTLGCTGQCVSSGQEAIDHLQSCPPDRRPDIVFMDFNMPVMDGFQATQAILAVVPHMPIVGLTADVVEAHHQKALASGMRDVMMKPFNKQKFIHACNEYATPSGPVDRRDNPHTIPVLNVMDCGASESCSGREHSPTHVPPSDPFPPYVDIPSACNAWDP